MIFCGTHINGIDAKGRVSVPADFRAVLRANGSETVHIWRSFNGDYLEGAGPTLMEKLQARIDHLALYDEGRNAFEFVMFGAMRPLNMDANGRITLPREFLDHAKLEREAHFVGMGQRFEILTPQAFEQRYQEEVARARQNRASMGVSEVKL